MRLTLVGSMIVVLGLAACSSGGFSASDTPTYAPTVDPRGDSVDGLVVGHRLMEAGEYELALDSFQRAAAEQGLTADLLSALGSANLGLGRLGQSETLLRRAVKDAPEWPEAWNNLGVVLIEKGETAEASEIFRKAYALDDGQSDSIRDNLRLALEKLDNSLYDPDQEQEYRLVRRGRGTFLISPTS